MLFGDFDSINILVFVVNVEMSDFVFIRVVDEICFLDCIGNNGNLDVVKKIIILSLE